MYHAPDREHGWRGSMAAALQTLRHAHEERVRQSIQHVIARLVQRTATEAVAHNSANSDHTSRYARG
ncbi:hypothetical protein [Chloroflexus sp.]|uniref:hypothetical protein n=2 Tax=Chloroflexus TaxID=1107 RepID=UPI0000459188|nr:hypothetical protein [Chloroflexus sp.]